MDSHNFANLIVTG